MSETWMIILIIIISYIFYLVRKFYRDPIEGTISVLKILRVFRWIGTFIVGFLYFIFPFDIIPDIVIPFGWIDDIGVFLTAHTFFRWITFPDRVERALDRLADRIHQKKIY